MADDFTSVLSIEVSLAPPPESDILSPFTSSVRPRPDNIEAFYADPSQLDRAMDELQHLGFRVLIASPLSTSVEGSPELFTEVFGTALETRSIQEEPVVEERARPVAESFLAPAPEARGTHRPPWSAWSREHTSSNLTSTSRTPCLPRSITITCGFRATWPC